MAREFFKNLPDTTTPLNAQRMNAFLNGEEAMGSIVVDDIRSKNLFDKNNNIQNGSFTDTGVIDTSSDKFVQLSYIPVESSKNYILHAGTVPDRLVICEYDSNKNFIKRNISLGTYTIPIATTSTTKYVRVCSSIAVLDTLQFEKGNERTEYTPYKKFGYNSQESMGKIIVDDITSKNIFDNQWLPLGKRYSNNSSSAFATTTAENNVGILNPIKLDRSKRYFYLYTNSNYTTNGIYFYDENGIWTGDRTFTNPNAVITIPETAYYMTFNIQGVTDINDLKSYEWMIEYVDSPTSTHTGYAPYKEISDKKTIISETIRKVNGQGTLVNGGDCATLGELISLVLKSDDKIKCSVGNTSTSAVKDVLGNPNIGNYVYAITEIIYFEGLNAMIRVIAHALYGNVVKTGYLLRDNVSDQWTGWQ